MVELGKLVAHTMKTSVEKGMTNPDNKDKEFIEVPEEAEENPEIDEYGNIVESEEHRLFEDGKLVQSGASKEIKKKGVFGDGELKRELKPEVIEKLYDQWVNFWNGQYIASKGITPMTMADGKTDITDRSVFDNSIHQWHDFIESNTLLINQERYEQFKEKNKGSGKTGKQALVALKSVLRWATGQSSKITASQIITLLTVAQYEGQKLSFYVDKTGQLKSTVSRHMLEMGQPTKLYKGLDWIDVRPHPHDARASQYFLTPKGHQFVEHIEEQLEMPYEEESLLSSVIGVPLTGLKRKIANSPPRGKDEIKIVTKDGKVKNIGAGQIEEELSNKQGRVIFDEEMKSKLKK